MPRSKEARKFRRKDSSSWYISWWETAPDGTRERFKISLGEITEREAELARQHKTLELLKGVQAAPLSPTFENFLPDYLAWHESNYPASHDRINQIARDHLPVFYSEQLDAIPLHLAEAWKSKRLATASAGTVQKEVRTLKAILNKAVEWAVIPANPLQALKPPKNLNAKAPQYFTIDQLQALYATGSHWRYVWQFLANTGLRRGEVMKAHRKDIHTGSRLMVESSDESTGGVSQRTKSGKIRVIPLSKGAKDALEYLEPDYLVPRINARSLSRAFDRDAKAAGLPTGIHQLRHTYASHLVMNRVPLRKVQVLMGHSSIAVTEQYSHLSPDYLDEQVVSLNL